MEGQRIENQRMKGNVEWLDDDDDDDDSSSVLLEEAITTTATATPRAARQERYHQSDDRQTDVVGGVNSRCTLMEIVAGGIAILSIATSAVAMIMVPSDTIVYVAGGFSW